MLTETGCILSFSNRQLLLLLVSELMYPGTYTMLVCVWFEWLFNLWDATSRKLLWSDCAHLSRQCLPTIHAQIWNVLTRKRQKGNLSMQRPILVGLSQSREETKKTESIPNHGDVMTVSSLPQKEGFLTITMCMDTIGWLLDTIG